MNGTSKTRVFTLATALAVALALILAQGTVPAFAETNGNSCPNGGIGNPQTSSLVGASFTINSNTAMYKFDSFVNRNPSGGVPGLIEYCVYPGT